jgi:peptidyl-prolyl cis-trans isomerase C
MQEFSHPLERANRPSAEVTAPGASLPSRRGRWRRWLREPLLHFLLIGVALFAAYRALHPTSDADTRSNIIQLTPDDLFQMSVVWLAQGRSAPTPDEMRSLIEQRVREEVLYREALALGLDKGDTIVKRRLAQKMEFLSEDISAVPEPASTALEAWFEKNAERFALEPRISFQHLYFSPDRRGASARDDAQGALAKLAGKPASASQTAGLSDPFMFQDSYGDRTPEQLAKQFGVSFAREIFKLRPGAWEGPIESGYGWHLIFADSISPSRVPAFAEVEAEAKSAFIEDQREASKRKIYEAMRAHYQVILPKLPIESKSSSDRPSALANR